MTKKFFPIKTETACQSKWAWSTVYLNTGITRSCHRTAETELTPENFENFHNTELKKADRQRMLEGKWPETSCGYCREVEEVGGFSDRMLHLTIPDLTPEEVEADPTTTSCTPSILEVYFNNTCNLGCIYCLPSVSSRLAEENRRFGEFRHGEVEWLPLKEKHLNSLAPKFWEYLHQNLSKIKRLHVLGGEPFLQPEFDELLDVLEETPAPHCEFNVVSNIMIRPERFKRQIERIKQLTAARKIKRFDLTASIDCWGPEQEYVRYGIDLELFKKNFEYLLSERWIKLAVNQCVNVLTIKSMPDLIRQLNEWKSVRQVGHYFSGTIPGPTYMRADIFGPGVFEKDFEEVLKLMKQDTDEERTAYKYMQGLATESSSKELNVSLTRDLFAFLNEIDRRRNENWRTVFPWLEEIEKRVV